MNVGIASISTDEGKGNVEAMLMVHQGLLEAGVCGTAPRLTAQPNIHAKRCLAPIWHTLPAPKVPPSPVQFRLKVL